MSFDFFLAEVNKSNHKLEVLELRRLYDLVYHEGYERGYDDVLAEEPPYDEGYKDGMSYAGDHLTYPMIHIVETLAKNYGQSSYELQRFKQLLTDFKLI